MIFVNFKTLEEASGEKGIALLKNLEEVSKIVSFPIIPCVSPIFLSEAVSLNVSLPLWVQSVSPFSYGAHTGSILAEDAKRLGAKGVLLNHSENKIQDFEILKKTLAHVRETGLEVLVFAQDEIELEKIAELNPNFLCYEPPELVGSTTDSVSNSHPDVIKKAVEIANRFSLPLIVGAGIHTEEDIRIALSFGAAGFAIATSIVKALDPKEEILKLAKGWTQ